jgi:hypothetical protein
MLTVRRLVLAGVLTLLLTASAPAQYGGMFYPRYALPGYQINPLVAQQALYQQALYNQALYNQALYNPVGGALPPYLAGAGRLSSTGYSQPPLPIPVTPTYPSLTDPYYGQGYSSQGVTPPYYYAPSVDTAGDTLRGLGDYTLAFGRYVQDYHKARLLNQEVERAKIETRRRLIEEMRYMQSLIPTAEEVRRANIERDLARARKQAPVSEVLSGKSLNDLLAHVRNLHAKGVRGPGLPLDEELLKRINVTTDFGGNIGLLKNGKINWPTTLLKDPFTKAREKVNDAAEAAFNQARTNGKIEPNVLKELDAGRKAMEDTLDKMGVDQLTMTEFIEARRYLNYLSDAIRALEDPQVANYFSNPRKYAARGKTITDLVDYMSREGLKFAGSMPGDEASYRSLYTVLAAYEEAMSALASR